MNSSLQAILSRRMIVTFFLGFSSGLPLLATGGTLQAWMKDENVDLSVIGIFALVGLPYTLKFLWAPLIDRFTPPFLGRRRGWMLITQIGLVLSLVGLGSFSPSKSAWMTAFFALLTTFFSASQDICLDAHRRDTLNDNELGLGSSLFISGYRIGMLVSGAFALALADHIAWSYVYYTLAAFVAVGIITTFLSPEPEISGGKPLNLKQAVIDPLLDFFKKSHAITMLAFILLYKIGDSMAANMTTPFILELGFSKSELAYVAKTFGLLATIGGGLIGGILMLRLGISKSLWIFGFMQAVSTLGFAVLHAIGYSIAALTSVVAFENLSSGMGTAAFVAYMASLTNRRFSATQYALLTSLMGVPRVIIAAPTGYMVESLGWQMFFVVCTALALPGMLLLIRVAPWHRKGANEII